MNDDRLSRKETTGGNNAGQETTSPNRGLLDGRMDAVQHVAWLSWFGEFEHGSVHKTQPVPGGHSLHVQAAHRQVLAHDAWTHGVPFFSKHFKQFNILNGHSPVRPTMFLVVVSIAHKTILFNFRRWNGLLRNAACRNTHSHQARRVRLRSVFMH